MRTVDSQGNPLRGATVLFGSVSDMFQEEFTTDARGEVHPTPVVRGGSYECLAILKGFYAGQDARRLPVVGGKGWKDVVTIVMADARRTQRGTVVYKDGKPVVGAMVYFGAVDPVSTDADGAFTLSGLPDQKVRITAVTTDGNTGSALASKDTGDVTIRLRETSPSPSGPSTPAPAGRSPLSLLYVTLALDVMLIGLMYLSALVMDWRVRAHPERHSALSTDRPPASRWLVPFLALCSALWTCLAALAKHTHHLSGSQWALMLGISFVNALLTIGGVWLATRRFRFRHILAAMSVPAIAYANAEIAWHALGVLRTRL